MIQDLFETGKDIYDQSATLCSKREDERHKLANLLELIGHLMNDAAAKLRYGQLPATKNQQLEMISEELYFRLAFTLGEIKARLLSSKLRNGYVVDQIKSELDLSQSTHHHLSTMEAAAGYFLATSDQLRTPVSVKN